MSENPFPILKKGHGRFKDVRRDNIIIIGKISDGMKTTLGPYGMEKMLVSPTGDIFTTNDGRAILENMAISNHITKLLVDVARTQDDLAGDGTKTAVVLTGELLKKADALLEMKVHPTTIISGYHKAERKALEVLNSNVIGVSLLDEEMIKRVAKTTIGGRVTCIPKQKIADLTALAVKIVAEETNGRTTIDTDHIDIRKKAGGSTVESKLVQGLIMCRSRLSPCTPEKIENAKIALMGGSLDPLVYQADHDMKEYEISNPAQLRGFIEGEKTFNKKIVAVIKSVGVNVLFCRKRISKAVLKCFSDERILAFDLVSEKDMARLECATGAKIITKIDELDERDLGRAGLVEFRKIAGDELLFIERCRDPKAVTVLIRGGTLQVVDRLERIFKSSILSVALAVEHGKALAGGGAIEIEIAKELKEYSKSLLNKEQLAIDAYGDALEEIPKSLATNAGFDPIDSLTKLRAGHAKGFKHLGIDSIKQNSNSPPINDLLDVFKAKQQAIKIATETATMILGISDIISVTNPKAIDEAESAKENEQQRIQSEKINTLIKEGDTFREAESIRRNMMERAAHPETM